MSDSDYAARQLRVIRSLMERATIYRSISAPTALIGGLLSLGGFATAYYAKHHRGHHPLSPAEFLVVWLVILALTAISNLFFLSRGSALRGEPFFSNGMKCAFFSLSPAFFLAGFLTVLFHRPIDLALIWITLYGVGLLATQHFAPRSLVLLGLAFFVTGCGLMVSWKHFLVSHGHAATDLGPTGPSALVVSGLMAAIFGGFHLAYAAVVWALGEDNAEPLPPPNPPSNV